MSEDEAQKLVDGFHEEAFDDDPLLFMERRLGIARESIDWASIPAYRRHKWDGTPNPIIEIIEAVKAFQWCAVSSATGVGKTYLGAAIILWFLRTFPNSVVVTTAPKEKQLTLHIWKEIGSMHERFGRGALKKLTIEMIPGSKEWHATGFVAGVKASEDSATKARGFHAEHMLIIIEETPGVPWETMVAFMDTSIAPQNTILAFGNPDHQLDNLSRFGNLSNVKKIRISALDHPNVVLKNPSFIRGATSIVGLERLKARYLSEMHPLYLSRARGISPTESKDSLIKYEWIYAARDRARKFQSNDPGHEGEWIMDTVEGMDAIGADVAASEAGDMASIAWGKGPTLLSVEAFHNVDVNQMGVRLSRLADDCGVLSEMIGVDAVGVGAGVIGEMRQHGREVVALMSGAKAIEITGDDKNRDEKFLNLRAQMWWSMREDLRLGMVNLPDDPELFADLTCPKWGEKQDRLIYVESKDEIKKRLGRSPNKGDAAVYWNWVRSGRDVAPVQSVMTAEERAQIEKDDAGYHATRRRSADVVSSGRERSPYHSQIKRRF